MQGKLTTHGRNPLSAFRALAKQDVVGSYANALSVLQGESAGEDLMVPASVVESPYLTPNLSAPQGRRGNFRLHMAIRGPPDKILLRSAGC